MVRSDEGSASDRAKARLSSAFREEERSGLMIAALVRAMILFAAAFYLALQSSLTGLPFWGLLGSVLSLAMLGLLQYLLPRFGINPPWQKFLFMALDCATMAMIFMTELSRLGTNVPPGMIIRDGGILFFSVFLVQAAFSFSPSLVLWTGGCVIAAWTAVMLDAVYDPRTTAEWWTPSLEQIPLYLQKYSNPAYLPISKWFFDVFCTGLVAIGLSFAVARQRRLVVAMAENARARANLARYFSPMLVDAMAARDDPFGQVRRQHAAVLFADLRDFTTFAEANTPERAMELLREYHAITEDEVFAAGGTLDNIMGDGLMATFGVPEPTGDDAARALACARSMLVALDRWNAERRRAGEPMVRYGIGIHCGPVVLGDVGSERSSAFVVVGDTVNTASRLQALTKELGVRLAVSAQILQAIERDPTPKPAKLIEDLHALGEQRLRGREGAVEVHVLA